MFIYNNKQEIDNVYNTIVEYLLDSLLVVKEQEKASTPTISIYTITLVP